MKCFVALYFYILLAMFPVFVASAADVVNSRPGPDFQTWVPAEFNNSIDWRPPWLTKNVYYNPADPSLFGFTILIIGPDKTDIVLLKVWNIRKATKDLNDYKKSALRADQSRLQTFFYRDTVSPWGDGPKDDVSQVESALWIGGSSWAIGSKGRMPHYTDSGKDGGNLRITIFQDKLPGYLECKKREVEGRGAVSQDPTFCDQVYDSGRGAFSIFISIPAFNW